MKQILCFGDSNTYGLIPGTSDQRYGWGIRWTSILDDKVSAKGYRVIEEGLCGRTTVFDDPFRTENKNISERPFMTYDVQINIFKKYKKGIDKQK